jgi:glycosyltransferase involved in cell wall biosynthesis
MDHHASNLVTPTDPVVSVIIPCYHSHGTLAACLDSLRDQSHRDFEVILIDSTPDDDRAVSIAEVYSFVRCHKSTTRLSAHAARNLGARHARGELLVFIDPDMRAHPEWLARLCLQQGAEARIVGGGVDCPEGYWNRAVHMTKYGWWLVGGRLQRRPQLPSGNVSIPRLVFERAGGFPARFWAGDSELSWRLRGLGHELWLEPEAVLTHLHEPSAREFVTERFVRGRDFGRARVLRERWGKIRCLAQTALLPAIPPLMALKASWFSARTRHLAWWFATLPVQLAGYAAWAAGEATAHVEGLLRGNDEDSA